VQLGHFLHAAGRDYITLERAPAAASFFSRYPVHRTLNSINRRHTRSGSLEFNLRHDWNSLLGTEDSIGLFGSWSTDYWPPADRLVEHINAFAAPQVEADRIRFNHNVTKIAEGSQEAVTEAKGVKERYLLTVDRQDSLGVKSTVRLACSVLIMANGMWKPKRVTDWIDNLPNVATQYSDLGGIPSKDFENRSVLIFGAGNAATETADAVRDVSRDIQIVSRSGEIRYLREHLYVGDVRGRRSHIHDAFHFKSYESVTEMCSGEHCDVLAVPCGPNDDNHGFQGKPPVCLFEKIKLPKKKEKCVVMAPVSTVYTELVEEAFNLFGDGVYIVDDLPDTRANKKYMRILDASIKPLPTTGVLCMHVDTIKGQMTLQQRQLLIRLRHSSMELTQLGAQFLHPYDVVITSLGWTYDTAVFHESVRIDMKKSPHRRTKADPGVYPILNSQYESTSAQDLFVAGAAAHGQDRYRYKASGGFIHGFRFICRTLWRILEERYEDSSLVVDGTTRYPLPETSPNLEFPSDDSFTGRASDMGSMWNKLLHRMNDAAGPYEMTGGSLVDAIVYDCDAGATLYIEDLPEDLVHERYLDFPRATWSYHHGCINCHGNVDSEVCKLRTTSSGPLSRLIHPVLQYAPPGTKPAKSQERMSESDWPPIHPSSVWLKTRGVRRLHITDFALFGEWSHPGTVRSLQIFMTRVEAAASQFCSSQGNGRISRRFDERFDVKLRAPQFANLLAKIEAKTCPEDHQPDDEDDGESDDEGREDL
jgi:thioredoxin reductase